MDSQLSTKKVLLGMSGGTDSSAAIILLQRAGYEVEGVTFRFYESDNNTSYLRDAADTAARLGIKHIVYDARDVFEKTIVNYFVHSYLSGETPTPCIVCNNSLKWPLLMKLADERGAYYLSTGHYAKVVAYDKKYYICEGEDRDKEQSFFLWGLSQEILKRIVFPLGSQQKQDMRALLEDYGLPVPARKKDSMGICFCPRGYQVLLREKCSPECFEKGIITDVEGVAMGTHEGYPFYTVGQRKGLGLNEKIPYFVKEIFPIENRIVAAPWRELYKTKIYLHRVNVIDMADFSDGNRVYCRIRYRLQQMLCQVTFLPDNRAEVVFDEPVNSIAKGQAAAFYLGNRVLGGGIIERAE